jgi:actin-related protein 9
MVRLLDGPAPVVNNSHKSKKQIAAQQAKASAAAAAAAEAANAAIAADVIVCKIPSLPDKQIELGTVRHRLVEPLFRGVEPGGDTVWEAVGRAIEHSTIGYETRVAVLESIGIIGDLARLRCKSDHACSPARS